MRSTCILLCLGLPASLLIGGEQTIQPQAVTMLGPGNSLGDTAAVRCLYPIPHVQELCTDDALQSGTCEIPAGLGHLWIASGAEEETAEELAGANVSISVYRYRLADSAGRSTPVSQTKGA